MPRFAFLTSDWFYHDWLPVIWRNLGFPSRRRYLREESTSSAAYWTDWTSEYTMSRMHLRKCYFHLSHLSLKLESTPIRKSYFGQIILSGIFRINKLDRLRWLRFWRNMYPLQWLFISYLETRRSMLQGLLVGNCIFGYSYWTLSFQDFQAAGLPLMQLPQEVIDLSVRPVRFGKPVRDLAYLLSLFPGTSALAHKWLQIWYNQVLGAPVNTPPRHEKQQ